MKKSKNTSMNRTPDGENAVKAVFTDAASGPFNDAFRALKPTAEALQASTPAPQEKPLPAEKPRGPEVKRLPAPSRAVVRMERKGHGGKEVTVIEIDLAPKRLESWLKLLKASLGCGGSAEGNTMVLQGDHRQRVRTWLEGQGVKKISVG